MIKCNKCGKSGSAIIYVDMNNKFCVSCYNISKNTNRELVKKLPFIKDKKAPLGYNFVGRDWFSDQLKGKCHTDWIFAAAKLGIN